MRLQWFIIALRASRLRRFATLLNTTDSTFELGRFFIMVLKLNICVLRIRTYGLLLGFPQGNFVPRDNFVMQTFVHHLDHRVKHHARKLCSLRQIWHYTGCLQQTTKRFSSRINIDCGSIICQSRYLISSFPSNSANNWADVRCGCWSQCLWWCSNARCFQLSKPLWKGPLLPHGFRLILVEV